MRRSSPCASCSSSWEPPHWRRHRSPQGETAWPQGPPAKWSRRWSCQLGPCVVEEAVGPGVGPTPRRDSAEMALTLLRSTVRTFWYQVTASALLDSVSAISPSPSKASTAAGPLTSVASWAFASAGFLRQKFAIAVAYAFWGVSVSYTHLRAHETD